MQRTHHCKVIIFKKFLLLQPRGPNHTLLLRSARPCQISLLTVQHTANVGNLARKKCTTYFIEISIICNNINNTAFLKGECSSVANWRRYTIIARYCTKLACNNQITSSRHIKLMSMFHHCNIYPTIYLIIHTMCIKIFLPN